MTGKQTFILTSYVNEKGSIKPKQIIQTLELNLKEDYPLSVVIDRIKKQYPNCIVSHTKCDD